MKKFIVSALVIFFLLFCMVAVFQGCSGSCSDITYESDDNEYTEHDEYDSMKIIHTITRNWKDYYNSRTYNTEYRLLEEWHEKAFRDRENLTVENWKNDNDFWRQVYLELYNQSKDQLAFVQDSLREIGDSLQLDRDDFARMVVSFVQDIPYNYIRPDSCDVAHSDFPCVSNVSYGLHSPVEFLCTLQGDCDTRTVLIFTMLRNFGYNPVIVNSNEYLHSMIALDIPNSGDYLEYRGKRYAFWETTNVGWLPGMLPPDMNNTMYWKIILDL